MRIDILTLFPEMCEAVLGGSIIGRAVKSGIVEVHCHNIRDYTDSRHRRVDDYPYGGGPGMLMSAEPIAAAFEAVCGEAGERPLFIYMSPQGEVFSQEKAVSLSKEQNICLLCGHYEGVDERVIEEMVDMEISCGDYVLTGGELPALIVTDAVCRMIPGVLSAADCYEQESHMSGLLEYPQYTRPAVWRGRAVPDVLLSGHEANILRWRRERSLEKTLSRRSDMLFCAKLTKNDRNFLVTKGWEKDTSE
ncbi:MAG: tRNA (guanosine(37)-N1)-methyltransferase TrmD [Oscillospiraceae bacterium]|jgi:tRNA (guanine37-N1)-methyltransferase|nr:tRNA (guanosine(37)-N1)-methyltransferase TrmD [Oscillospiraceae bacterium]